MTFLPSTRTAKPEDLPKIISLWRSNSRTLGFFPEGAFLDALEKNHIIVAEYSGEFAGYLLYRVGRDRATIVHLCSEKRFRGKGIAQVLNKALLERTCQEGCAGVALSCRRDFNLSDFWTNLGYIPLTEKPGRSAKGHLLTFWWHDHHQPDLFSHTESTADDERLAVVVDMNVLIRLHEEDDSQVDEVAKALEADWLADFMEICVTPEAYVEADRAENSARRKQTRQWIRRHRELKPDDAAVERAKTRLYKYFPEESLVSINDRSDFHHTAYALAADADVLITLDENLLKRAGDIDPKLGLRVVDPADFILSIDSLLRGKEYAPERLMGSRVLSRLVKENDRKSLSDCFQASSAGESRAQFNAKVRSFLAKPVDYAVLCHEHPEDGFLTLLVKGQAVDGSLSLPLFRFTDHNLAPTLARRCLSSLITECAAKGIVSLRVTDKHLSRTAVAALEDFYFKLDGSVWVRYVKPGIHPLDGALGFIEEKNTEQHKAAINLTPERAFQIERRLWPGKLKNSPLPSFVVPIRPGFAMQLFDANLAVDDLLGSSETLALACENVYYRSAKRFGLEAPARVLWYVSKGNRYSGCMSIRACSLLTEIHVDTPKKLYSRYKRFGVFEWRNLAAMVRDPARDPIMAFIFSHTELFTHPVPRDCFRTHGIRSNLQSPVRIEGDAFEKLYTFGMTHG